MPEDELASAFSATSSLHAAFGVEGGRVGGGAVVCAAASFTASISMHTLILAGQGLIAPTQGLITRGAKPRVLW